MSTAVPRLTWGPYLLLDTRLGPKENPELNLKNWEEGLGSFAAKAVYFCIL